ncbi:MAG: GDP-mannose 4,6-dehydratase [Thermoguttaceae bacterium]
MTKTALITGITGQDGAYLARLLLQRGYLVHGIRRRSSTHNANKMEEICSAEDRDLMRERLLFHFGDMNDATGLVRIVEETQPDEIYNLAAMSHVRVSFDTPEYTSDVNALGTLRILEAIRLLGLEKKTRFYQASTSELFGGVSDKPFSELSPFYPRSPYAVAKLFAFWSVVNYREAYNMFACNGILFNHESPLRGENFVTRKITQAVCRIKMGRQEKLTIGNMDAWRDWGHAADYVEGMVAMLQQNEPEDFVLATGECHQVRELIEIAFDTVKIPIVWKGSGLKEQGLCHKTKKILVEVDPQFFRPTEVDTLCGDASKARQKLNWKPKCTFSDLVREMIEHDLRQEEIGQKRVNQ